MVSFSSLLGFFKKPDSTVLDDEKGSATASSSTSPDHGLEHRKSSITPSTVSKSQETTNTSAPRFLSLRSRSGSRHLNVPTSSFSIGKPRPANQAPQRENAFGGLPKLDLGPDIKLNGINGVEDSSAPAVIRPILTGDEEQVLKDEEFGLEEVKAAWVAFGQALQHKELSPELMLQRASFTDLPLQYRLIALFLLQNQPGLAGSFPSLQPTKPPIPTTKKRTITHLSFGESLAQDPTTPSDICSILKFFLRRLRTPSPPLFDKVLYTKFVQAEYAASYPHDAYDMLFRPRLPLGVGAYLDAIFEVFATIIGQSSSDELVGSKLCSMLGWWIWGNGAFHTREGSMSTGDTYAGQAFEKVYRDWLDAGRRVQHLFYAWIRLQTTKRTLSLKLTEVIKAYPYGAADSSSEHLPSPPSSSTTRHTIHVKLESTTTLDSTRRVSPRELFQALSTAEQADESTQLSKMLSSTATQEWSVDAHKLLSEESMLFLYPKGEIPTSPLSKTPIYRPFHTVSQSSFPDLTNGIRKAQSSADLRPSGSSTPQSPNDYFTNSASNGPSRSPLSVRTPSPVTDWADFAKAGFGDSPPAVSKLDLSLAPSSVPLPTSPASPRSPGAPQPRPRARPPPKLQLCVTSEEALDIDDGFISFVEDAQSDPSSISWSPFVLVRLQRSGSSNEQSPPHAESFDWLLLSLQSPSVPPPPPGQSLRTAHTSRSTSPNQGSTMSSPKPAHGFREVASNFKRSVSLSSRKGSFRKSVFGGSIRNVSQPAALAPLAELGPVLEIDKANQSDARILDDRTITALGSRSAKKQGAAVVDPTRAVRGPSSDSPVEAWDYVAEGGAHFVFAYKGINPAYTGCVLRIPKSPHVPDDPLVDAKKVWREELLPKLIPGELLPSTQEVALPQSWVDDLVNRAGSSRPSSRLDKEEASVTKDQDRLVNAILMEDLRASTRGDGETVLTIEIKPKWGFLPRADHVRPEEAADVKSRFSRYRLHQHYRGQHDQDDYDPLDLFSGVEARMRRAVYGLWKIWERTDGEANNWRVAVDGKQVKLETVHYIPGVETLDDAQRVTAEPVISLLWQSGVLHVIRKLQSTLDATDISELADRFETEHPQADLFDPSILPEPTVDELRDFISVYIASAHPTPESWTFRQSLIAYALSAIFKDCSIFVKAVLLPSSANPDMYVLQHDKSSVKIIDLDLKHLGNMRKWYELDEKIWKHWLASPPRAYAHAWKSVSAGDSSSVSEAAFSQDDNDGDSDISETPNSGLSAASTSQ